MTLRFTIAGMTCQRCVARVKAAALAVEGIASAEIDLASKTACVETADTQPPSSEQTLAIAIASAISNAGYPATLQSALL
jgi:copper chaperone CopZ